MFVSAAPPVRHQSIVGKLVTVLHGYLSEKQAGIALCAPLDVYLSYNDIVQPDLLVVLERRRNFIFEHGIVGAPNVVIEVLSSTTSTVDKVRKTALYARNRVEEYWIVDPLSETVTVYCLYGDRFSSSAVLSKTDRLYSPILKGLVLDLEKIFPDALSGEPVAPSEEP